MNWTKILFIENEMKDLANKTIIIKKQIEESFQSWEICYFLL